MTARLLFILVLLSAPCAQNPMNGDRIVFIGEAARAGVQARDTIRVTERMVTPGFIDMHSGRQPVSELDLQQAPVGRVSKYWLHLATDGMSQPVRVPVMVARGSRPGSDFGSNDNDVITCN